jgi:hypothetical protein
VSDEISEIVRAAQSSFADFAYKREITNDPLIRQRMARRDGWRAELLRPVALVSPNNFRVRGKRFVFLNTRFQQLAASFSGEEAALIGGPGDYGFAKAHGLPFCFSGDLYVAAFGVLFGKPLVPVRSILRRWLRFFRQQRDPCYLVVANDTMPLALTLVHIARRCANVVVVCVEHGLLSAGPGFEYDDLEGRDSHVNLVYTQAQKLEYERRLPGALVEVMGCTSEFEPLQPGPGERRAILVGVGTFEDLGPLKASLRIFGDVAKRLAAAGWRVEYRPHPSELGLGLIPDDVASNRQEKRELLAGRRKLFLGFGSTLLYEADVAGHAVIVLDHPEHPGYSIADFGSRLDARFLDDIGGRADAALSAPSAAAATSGVRERFEQALARALSRRRDNQPSEQR